MCHIGLFLGQCGHQASTMAELNTHSAPRSQYRNCSPHTQPPPVPKSDMVGFYWRAGMKENTSLLYHMVTQEVG